MIITQAIKKLVLRDEFTPLDLRHGSEQFIFVLGREAKGLIGFSGDDGDNGTLCKAKAFHDDFPGYDRTSGDLHG